MTDCCSLSDLCCLSLWRAPPGLDQGTAGPGKVIENQSRRLPKVNKLAWVWHRYQQCFVHVSHYAYTGVLPYRGHRPPSASRFPLSPTCTESQWAVFSAGIKTDPQHMYKGAQQLPTHCSPFNKMYICVYSKDPTSIHPNDVNSCIEQSGFVWQPTWHSIVLHFKAL